MKSKLSALFMVLLVLSLILTACAPAAKETAKEEPIETGGRLQLIKDRGSVIVGCNAELPGFGYLNPAGEFEGFDVDFGKAIAAAIFGDATKVEFRSLTADRKSTRLNSSHTDISRMPSSA